MNAEISVIIPVYNCKDLLARAIESVIKQKNFACCELILVDDGSTDGSSDICDEFSGKFSNIKVIHQANAGVSVARNNGISNATGEWICFLDSDDYLLDDAFVNMMKYGKADIICAKYDSNVPDKSDYESHFKSGLHNLEDIFEPLSFVLMSSHQFFYPCWSKLYKRSIIFDNNITFPAGRKYAEDMVFVYSYIKHCKTISFVDENVYFYYVNAGNATTVIPKSFDTYLFIYDWKKSYFEDLLSKDEKLKNYLVSSFLFKSFFSLKTAVTYLKGMECIKYISLILNNDTFYSLYTESDEYKSFKAKNDEILDKLIRKKKPFLIYLFFKLIALKSKFYSS